MHSMDIKVDDAGDFFEAVAALKQVRGWVGVVSTYVAAIVFQHKHCLFFWWVSLMLMSLILLNQS